MKKSLAAILFILSCGRALAQGLDPMTDKDQIVAEYSNTVSLGWGGKMTWSNYLPTDVKWSRSPDGLEVISDSSDSRLIDTKTYLHHPASLGGRQVAGAWQLTETVSQSTTRDGRMLQPGTTWKADRSYVGAPVSYCAHNTSKLDSKFEVGTPEPYALVINGKPTTLDVTPVVERGYWTRCYSGKRYTRFLVSKDLDAVVSIEHVGYTPSGPAHESSYRLNIKEIKRP